MSIALRQTMTKADREASRGCVQALVDRLGEAMSYVAWGIILGFIAGAALILVGIWNTG
jgi:hypothetical protein